MAELRSDYASLPVHHIGDAVPVSGPPIVLSFDSGFAFPAQVALVSIFLNSPLRSLDIVVLASGWPDSTVAGLDILARRFNRALTVIRVDEAMLPAPFAARPVRRGGLFRLMIPEILNGERFLYLDADIVAQIDLDEIWGHYRGDLLVGGVPDLGARYWQRRLGFTEPDLYVNSGVLLINGRAWRDERALERCAAWLQSNPQRMLADQDTLNSALLGSIYAIPDHWNVIGINRPQEWRLDPDSFRGIYHFAGPVKPWMRWADPALQEFYLHYARVVGLPAGYWVEARNAREALAEAQWADRQGNLVKARDIYKRVAEAALAKLKEVSPDAMVELP